MVDLRKEIKLSDLVPKRRPKAAKAAGPSSAAKRKTKKQDLVGVKIGATQLAAAHVANDGGPRLLKVARQPLEDGVVVGGEVRDIAALGRALDDFFRDNDLPRKNVRAGIGTSRVGVRVLDIDGIEDEKQLTNAIMFRANEALSIPMDQTVLDYHVVDSRPAQDGGASWHRVILAAAYRDPIDHIAAAFDAAGIQLAAIDVEAFALLRAVSAPYASVDDEPSAVVALALGHDKTTLAISNGKVCDFTRVLDWGGGRLDTAIARELGVTADEATEIKQGLDLNDDDPSTGRARNAVKSELTALARELVASLQFYQAQPDSLALAEILVTGGTTRMPGLVEELERLIRARVRLADPLDAVRAPADVASRDDLSSLTVAIGLGMER